MQNWKTPVVELDDQELQDLGLALAESIAVREPCEEKSRLEELYEKIKVRANP